MADFKDAIKSGLEEYLDATEEGGGWTNSRGVAVATDAGIEFHLLDCLAHGSCGRPMGEPRAALRCRALDQGWLAREIRHVKGGAWLWGDGSPGSGDARSGDVRLADLLRRRPTVHPGVPGADDLCGHRG